MIIAEHPSAEQVSSALVAEYRGVATSIISDNLSRLPGATGILPYHKGGHMIGTALTVKTRAGDTGDPRSAQDRAGGRYHRC